MPLDKETLSINLSFVNKYLTIFLFIKSFFFFFFFFSRYQVWVISREKSYNKDVSLFHSKSTFCFYLMLNPSLTANGRETTKSIARESDEVNTFPQVIDPRTNVIMQQEIELTYLEAAVQLLNHHVIILFDIIHCQTLQYSKCRCPKIIPVIFIKFCFWFKKFKRESRGVMANELDCDVVVSLGSNHAITFTFGLISLGKVWKHLSPPPQGKGWMVQLLFFNKDGFGIN